MYKVKVLVMDVDGTLTDGKIYMGEKGELFKAFDCKDGYAVREMLRMVDVDWGENHEVKYEGIIPVVITARKSEIVEKRCKEMGVEFVYQGCNDKVRTLVEFAERLRLNKKIINNIIVYPEIAYIGDDVLDISCMKISGVTGCPQNSVKIVKEMVDFVSTHNGGDGAVREFIQWILDNR